MRVEWTMQIPVGAWMQGLHTFKTKKKALEFQSSYFQACGRMFGVKRVVRK